MINLEAEDSRRDRLALISSKRRRILDETRQMVGKSYANKIMKLGRHGKVFKKTDNSIMDEVSSDNNDAGSDVVVAQERRVGRGSRGKEVPNQEGSNANKSSGYRRSTDQRRAHIIGLVFCV